jgi:hypothetical protein
LKYIGWEILWEHPNLAILKAYYSAISFDDRGTYQLGSHRFGSRFLDTIRGLGLHSQAGRIKSIYETCALVVCSRAPELAGINPHRLRGNTRASDGAKGWRADISQKGPGYRLHYWQCRDGSIELSCVNVHRDMAIY